MKPEIDARPLALIGMRCSGKTLLGWLLARRLGRAFVDLDEKVLWFARQSGHAVSSVGEILSGPGLATFRDLEANVLKLVLEPAPLIVLATGGGAVERSDSRAWLRRVPLTVYLSVPVALLQARLRSGGAERPALLGSDPVAEVPALLARREAHYRALADLVVDCGDAAPEELLARVMQGLRSEAE